MPHIESHVLDSGGSFGTLSLEADPSIILSFLPPPFPIKKGDTVGFFPIFNNKHTEILGFDIAMWNVHEVAEEMAIQKLGGIARLEEIYNMPDKQAGVELMISEGGLQTKYCDILRDVLNYFTYPDFRNLYINSVGEADSAYAEKQIIAFYKKTSAQIAGASVQELAKKKK